MKMNMENPFWGLFHGDWIIRLIDWIILELWLLVFVVCWWIFSEIVLAMTIFGYR